MHGVAYLVTLLIAEDGFARAELQTTRATYTGISDLAMAKPGTPGAEVWCINRGDRPDVWFTATAESVEEIDGDALAGILGWRSS